MGTNARNFLLTEFDLISIIDFQDLPIFKDALTYVGVFSFRNDSPKKDFKFFKIENIDQAKSGILKNSILISTQNLNENPWKLKSTHELRLISKVENNPALKEIGKCWYGIISGNDDVFILNETDLKNLKIEQDVILPLIRAENCYRYGYSDFDKFIIYPYILQNNKTTLIEIETIKSYYPNLHKYLIINRDRLEGRKDSRKTFESRNDWYSLTRFGQLEEIKKSKIVFPGECKKNKFGLDLNQAGYSGARVFSITINKEDISLFYILAILNSKVVEFYLHSIAPLKQGGYYSYSSNVIDKVPIPQINSASQAKFINLVENILDINLQFKKVSRKFLQRIKSTNEDLILTKKLNEFYLGNFSDFLTELKNQKKILSLKQQDEWEDYFNEYKTKLTALQAEIDQTDREIDQMVYELYGLTPEEIKIVEESVR